MTPLKPGDRVAPEDCTHTSKRALCQGCFEKVRRDAWNKAIEAAAKEVKARQDNCQHIGLCDRVRALKVSHD